MPRKKKPDKGKEKEIYQDAQEPLGTLSGPEMKEFLRQFFIEMPESGESSKPDSSQNAKTQEFIKNFLSQVPKAGATTSSQKNSQSSGSSTPKQDQRSGSSTPIQIPKSSPSSLESIALELTQAKLPTTTYGEIVRPKRQSNLVISDLQPLSTISSSQAIVTHKYFPGKNDAPFLKKANLRKWLVQLEPEFMGVNPKEVAARIFPQGMYYQPKMFSKGIKFYEAILLHTESVKITHNMDNRDKGQIAFSKFNIQRVFTPSMWGQNLLKPREFPKILKDLKEFPETYTYWDYVDAWEHVFWFQNKTFSHTWLIYFTCVNQFQFPQWFIHWWRYFGPLLEIYPEEIIEGFKCFKEKFSIDKDDHVPVSLYFCSNFPMTWIFSWQYEISKPEENSKLLPVLYRVPYSRFWNKQNTKQSNKEAVEEWFKKNPKALCYKEQSKFLMKKSRAVSMVAGSSDQAQLAAQIAMLMQIFQDKQEQPQLQLPSTSGEQSLPDSDEEYAVDLGED